MTDPDGDLRLDEMTDAQVMFVALAMLLRVNSNGLPPFDEVRAECLARVGWMRRGHV